MTDKELKRLAVLIANELSDSPLRPFYKPREVAKSPTKIIGWIRRGEIAGVNVADTLAGRARWRIPSEAIADFLKRRKAIAEPKRRRSFRQPRENPHGPLEHQANGPRLAKRGNAALVGKVWYHKRDGIIQFI